MPAIIKEDKQVKALQEIEEALGQIKTLNAALDKENSFAILAGKGELTARNAIKITVDEKSAAALVKILLAQKEKLVKEVTAKATKNRIALDDSDKELMDWMPDGVKV